jgi:NADH-quinone oxidoreductase subunit M
MELPILSINILLLIFSSIYIGFFTNRSNYEVNQNYPIYVGILSSILTVISSIYLYLKYANNKFEFIEYYSLIKNIGLNFHLGVDGISIIMILLTVILTPIALIFSIGKIEKHSKYFVICILLVEAMCIGAFSARNLLLFFIFFELILIPIYLLIGIFGGENRIFASIKFFLYSFISSCLFLICIIYIYTKTHNFEIESLRKSMNLFSYEEQKLLWFGIFFSFAIKIPMFPFHNWLPNAHVEASTSTSIILAGLLLKLGAYGFIIILIPLFPLISKEYASYVYNMSIISIIYASLVAFAQTDIKKMIAYSSIAHMNYSILGIFSFSKDGIIGAIFQMFSHGIISAGLFIIAGIFYDRYHTRQISWFGGIVSQTPKLSFMFMIMVLGSIGLPGTSGFIGEFFIIYGMAKINIFIAILAATSVVITTVYMFSLYKDLMLGSPRNSKINSFKDLSMLEFFSLSILGSLVIYLGIVPGFIMKLLQNI